MSKPLERLVELASGLPSVDQETLVAFAEFLLARQPKRQAPSSLDSAATNPGKSAESTTAVVKSSPAIRQDSPATFAAQRNIATASSSQTESLVAAIKRLVAENPQLSPHELLSDTAGLMERFVAGACTKEDAIRELEALFAARG